MVLQMPRPFKHPKTNVYYFRVRVPADLVEAVGRKEIKISLGTKDPATAKELFAEKEQQVAKQWKALRSSPEPMPHKQIVALSGKLYLQMMSALENEPGDPAIWTHTLRLAEEAEQAGKLEQWCGRQADALLRDEGVSADVTSRARLLVETNRAFKQFAEQQAKRSIGDYSPDPNAGRFPSIGKTKLELGGPSLQDLFDLWKRDHLAEGKAPRTIEDFRQKIDDLSAFLGHQQADAITPEDIARYVEHLQHGRGLSSRTVHSKYLAAIRTVYRTALSKIRIKVDPTHAVKVRVPKGVRVRSPGFTDDEARAILSCALSDPSLFGKMADLNKVACKWVPWLCAYTGARAGEITQLRKEDVINEDGIDAIRITPEAGSVKTRQYRIVPLHPHLIELGFLDFIKSRPAGPLFYAPSDRNRKPGHTQAASVRGKVGDWVRDFAKVVDPRVQPNHAWRHRFKTIARDVDIAPRYMDAIQGHEDGSASSGYGEYSLKALYREIMKIPRYEVKPPCNSQEETSQRLG